jgi:hypothetical protein
MWVLCDDKFADANCIHTTDFSAHLHRFRR